LDTEQRVRHKGQRYRKGRNRKREDNTKGEKGQFYFIGKF